MNNARSCLSEPARRLEYDGVFRMRCVLEQGQLSAAALRERPLDLVYMFAVTVRKSLAGGGGLGLREENVLIFNLEAARLERWRGGDVVDSRPLAALRGVRDGDGDAAGSLRLLLGEEGEKETSLALSARSAADAAAITRLVTRLVTALTAGGLRLREDDSDMPPPAVMSGWLTMRAAAPTSKVGVGALQASLPSSGALSRPESDLCAARALEAAGLHRPHVRDAQTAPHARGGDTRAQARARRRGLRPEHRQVQTVAHRRLRLCRRPVGVGHHRRSDAERSLHRR